MLLYYVNKGYFSWSFQRWHGPGILFYLCMTDRKVFTNSLGQDFCTVVYSPSLKMVTVTWNGGTTVESVKRVREYVLSLLKEHSCPFLLIDMQELLLVSSKELIRWLKEEWDAVAATHGLHFIANVAGNNSIAETYLLELKAADRPLAAKAFTMEIFHSRSGAMDWLLEKKRELGL